MSNRTGSGWKFGEEVPRALPEEPGFDPNEPLNFDLIDEANKEENEAQEEEGRDWWRK